MITDVERVQRWRKNNPGKYKELEQNRQRDRRAPERKFLESIGFDQKRDTIRKQDGKWLILSKDKAYIILECKCKATDCKGYALVENNETMINLHNNLMKLSDILGESSKCITKRLEW